MMIFPNFRWLMRQEQPSLAEFFRVVRGKNPSITDARAECRVFGRSFKEALKRRNEAHEAMYKALEATGVTGYGEPWEETIAKMNPAEETTKAFLNAKKANDKAQREFAEAKREYDRALARL